MDDAGRQSAQGHHLVLVEYFRLVRHLSFQASQLPQIADEQNHPCVRFVFVQHGCRNLDRNLTARSVRQHGFVEGKAIFPAVGFRCHRRLEFGGAAPGEEPVDRQGMQDIPLAIGEHLLQTLVKGHHLTLGIKTHNPVHGVFNQVSLIRKGFHEFLGRIRPSVFQIPGVIFDLLLSGVTLSGPVQSDEQQILVDRLCDEIRGIELQRTDSQIHLTEGGDDNHLDIRKLLLYGLQHLQSVHPRHANIGDDDLRGCLRAQTETGLPVGGGDDRIPGILQCNAPYPSDALFIIDNNDLPRFRCRHGRPVLVVVSIRTMVASAIRRGPACYRDAGTGQP